MTKSNYRCDDCAFGRHLFCEGKNCRCSICAENDLKTQRGDNEK